MRNRNLSEHQFGKAPKPKGELGSKILTHFAGPLAAANTAAAIYGVVKHGLH
jgi:hypothetical protein